MKNLSWYKSTVEVRGKVTVAADADEETVKTVAFADENVKKFTDNTQIVESDLCTR